MTYLNKWELTLYLLWRSDEKSLLKIVKKKNVADYTLYRLISTCHQVLEILKGDFSPGFLVNRTHLPCSLPGEIHGMDIDWNSRHSLLRSSEIMCKGGHFPL